MGLGGYSHDPAALPLAVRLGTQCRGGSMGRGPVWTGTEDLAFTGIRSPAHPVHSESLYRQRYPGSSV